MDLQHLLNNMWIDYCELNPAAARIFQELTKAGETVLNDHIALRTFQHPDLGIESMAQHFKALGYVEKNEYFFQEKKLYAKHYEHKDAQQPKIFISELELSKMSTFVQQSVQKMISEIPKNYFQDPSFMYRGRPWKMDHKTYLALAEESEYASWVGAIGFRPNHFTVNINALKNYSDIHRLNEFLIQHGYTMNTSGGIVKGSPELFLEQSSTMAENVEISFTDGHFKIPGCYYEFAKRYPLASGVLYQGFVAQSADKIFESTNRR
jgi:hypothetical protein